MSRATSQDSRHSKRSDKKMKKRSASVCSVKKVPKKDAIYKAEEKFLASCINDLIRIEQDVENMKIELSQQEDFNLIDAYGLLDTHC